MTFLGSFLLVALTSGPVQSNPLTPTFKSIGLTKLQAPPVEVAGTTLRVISGKSAFSVAGPQGSAFQFQPAVPQGSSFESASLQVNGTNVAVGKFSNGRAPVLGYSPSDAHEIAVYRVTGGGKSQTLATYDIRTDGKELHPPQIQADGETLRGIGPKEGSCLLFGPSGLLGQAGHEPFSVDLSSLPTGLCEFKGVYLKGDYAEAPVSTEVMIDSRLGIDGVDQPVPAKSPVTIHVRDTHHKGVKSVIVYLNNKRLGEFDDWQGSILLNLADYNEGSYKLAVVGRLADGSTLGPETRTLELADESATPKPVERPPTLSDIVIQSAWYGANGQVADVTDRLMSFLRKGLTTIDVTNANFGDPASGVHKLLTVRYALRGKAGTITVDEGKSLDITSALDIAPSSFAVAPSLIKVVSAVYYDQDVTAKVQAAVNDGNTTIRVDPGTFGIPDPAVGVHKTLTVTVLLPDGNSRTFTGTDGETVTLIAESYKLLDSLTNGSFDSDDSTSFFSSLKYVPASNGALNSPGVFTFAEGVLRPFELGGGLRLDFTQNTRTSGSKAMFINPGPGRQPILLWGEKIKVQPNTQYELSAYCADVSDNNDSSWVSIVLDIDGVKAQPVYLVEGDRWVKVWLTARTGSKPYVTVRIWRDVLPPFASSGSLVGIDDISIRTVH
ncbi:MAG TPA: hypothetical protein VG944_00255 [Fimbriimonas sp.]|nr:hypothetical protein [Fimbriimonas sp.]